MSGFNFAIGDTVEIPWRPERPVKVDDRMYEAVTRLRSAGIVAAQRRSTLTYAEAATAIDELYRLAASAERSIYSRMTAASAESLRLPHWSSGRTRERSARAGLPARLTQRENARGATSTGVEIAEQYNS